MEEVKEYSLAERLNHVSVWRNSGLLLANYSRQTGIPIKTLRYWATIAPYSPQNRRPMFASVTAKHIYRRIILYI
ncbi:MAG: hypothetical protein JWR54_2850 [Mucilaginibacter sp.]|nr:hypothetical protein [Mucilaginibacter sp.]